MLPETKKLLKEELILSVVWLVTIAYTLSFLLAVSFSYSSSDSEEVSMNVNRIGMKKGGTFKCNSNTEITPNQMR